MKLDDVIPAARALVPAARERAEKTEAARTLLPEAERELRDAGMFRLLQPKRFGGLELDPAALVRASSEVGRGCGSTAWCLGVLVVHNWMLGLYDERAQEDVWGEDPNVLLAASFAPTGTAERTADGIRVSGRWSFASGCDVSQWMMVGAVLEQEGTAPDLRLFLVPRSEYRVDDNWHVSGLAGTGSKDIVIDDALVPEYRSLSIIEASAGRSPGGALYDDSPLFRVPFGSMLLFALVGPGLGIARGAYDDFLKRVRTRQITYTVEKQAEQTPVQILLGEAAHRLDAVELMWDRDLDEIARITREKREFTLEQRARYKRDVGLGLRDCQQVVARLAAASGAHGIFLSNPMQRAFRDVHAMTTHAALDPGQAARTAGRVALGLDPATAIL